MDVGQGRAHARPVAFGTEVGDVPFFRAALACAVAGQRRENDLFVFSSCSEEGDGDVENLPERGPVGQDELSRYMVLAVGTSAWEHLFTRG